MCLASPTGQVATFKAVPAGTMLDISFSKVMATNTTVAAGSLVAGYR